MQVGDVRCSLCLHLYTLQNKCTLDDFHQTLTAPKVLGIVTMVTPVSLVHVPGCTDLRYCYHSNIYQVYRVWRHKNFGLSWSKLHTRDANVDVTSIVRMSANTVVQ